MLLQSSIWPTYCSVYPRSSASLRLESPASVRQCSNSMAKVTIAGASYGSDCVGIGTPGGEARSTGLVDLGEGWDVGARPLWPSVSPACESGREFSTGRQ